MYMSAINICWVNMNVYIQTYMKQHEHVHLIWQIFVAYLLNVNLGWRVVGITGLFSAPKELFEGRWDTHCYSGSVVSGPTAFALGGGGLLRHACFHPTVDLLNQNAADGGPAEIISRNLPKESDAHESVRTTGRKESLTGIKDARDYFPLGTFERTWRR